MPNNYELAHSRLLTLKNSLDRRGILARYDAEIQKMIDKRYAEILSETEDISASRIWYLPHHAVDARPCTHESCRGLNSPLEVV